MVGNRLDDARILAPRTRARCLSLAETNFKSFDLDGERENWELDSNLCISYEEVLGCISATAKPIIDLCMSGLDIKIQKSGIEFDFFLVHGGCFQNKAIYKLSGLERRQQRKIVIPDSQ